MELVTTLCLAFCALEKSKAEKQTDVLLVIWLFAISGSTYHDGPTIRPARRRSLKGLSFPIFTTRTPSRANNRSKTIHSACHF